MSRRGAPVSMEVSSASASITSAAPACTEWTARTSPWRTYCSTLEMVTVRGLMKASIPSVRVKP